MGMKAQNAAGGGLIQRMGAAVNLAVDAPTDAAWIEVIQKMDAIYANLVQYQVELEEKNAALEEAQQFIRGVLSAMTDVLVVCDVEGRIEQVNRALSQLTGKEEAQLRHLPFRTLFAPESQPLLERFPDRIRAQTIEDCEVNLLARDGQAVPLAMNCSPRFDHDGRLLGMVVVGRPVGELRLAYETLRRTHRELQQAQQQLVQSEKMASLGRLVAGVAHELNNPISFVFGNMHALKRYGDRINRYLAACGQAPGDEALDRLRRELRIDHVLNDMGSLIDGTLEGAQRVSEIVQDLRRYSGSQREPRSRFDLVPVIHTATHWVFKAARVKPQVRYETPEAMPIHARKGHVQQILINLVQNAVDVLENQPGPLLVIGCTASGNRVTVTVRDNGPGIAGGELTRIFDPFYTTKPVGKGTGLGLSISYGLAREAGGNLTAASHPGGGAMFTLELPLENSGDAGP